MSFGTFGPLLSLGIAAVLAVGIIVRLIRAARQRRTRAEFRSIGNALSGAGAAQSTADGWAPHSLAPMEGPTVSTKKDDTTGQVDDDREASR